MWPTALALLATSHTRAARGRGAHAAAAPQRRRAKKKDGRLRRLGPGFAEEPVAERNPIAAAFGFPGAYWWEADYNLQQPHRYASFDAGSVSGTPERRPDARRYSSTAPAWFSGTTPPKKSFVVKPKTPPLTHLDFRPRRPLGKGKFGEVYLTTHQPSGRLYALKVLHKRLLYNSKLRERARNERRINGALGPHPFIIRMQYAFATEKCLCLVLDLAPCGELFQLVKVAHPWKNGKTKPGKFPEQAARFYVAECLLALEFLHERRVLYRDLKTGKCINTARRPRLHI